MTDTDELSKALIMTIDPCSLSLAQRLLAAGADPNYQPSSETQDRHVTGWPCRALVLAHINRHTVMIELLIQAGAVLNDQERAIVDRLSRERAFIMDEEN